MSPRIFECTKPVIAAVNGPAVGVGATMTLPMDIRLAAPEARFGFVFARRGIVPEAASSWFLPRVVGINRAMEWVATGRVFGAEEALAAGLVRSVHPAGALLQTARALAREIADHTAPVSVAIARRDRVSAEASGGVPRSDFRRPARAAARLAPAGVQVTARARATTLSPPSRRIETRCL